MKHQPLVVVVVYDGLAMFEFGIVAESFGATDGKTAGIDDGLGSFNFYPMLSASYGASQN